ncbi:MAG: type II/IV secretion system ATPase subunit [Candidatus Micrarchaeota archaeon]
MRLSSRILKKMLGRTAKDIREREPDMDKKVRKFMAGKADESEPEIEWSEENRLEEKPIIQTVLNKIPFPIRTVVIDKKADNAQAVQKAAKENARKKYPAKGQGTMAESLDSRLGMTEFDEEISSGFLPVQNLEPGVIKGVPREVHLIPKSEVTKRIPASWEPPSLEDINLKYPLIEPYSYAVIIWDKKTSSLSYTVIEPPLTKEEDEKLDTMKKLIIELLDINLMDVKNKEEVKKYIKQKLDEIIVDYEIKVKESEYSKILYYVYRNFLGLDTIEPMMQDAGIEDISCDGVGIPLYIFHRKYGSLRTNIIFSDAEELNRFITKLAQRCGKHISVADPLLDGALPDGSRLQATFSTGGDIAMRGSTFTIRKFTKDPLTVIDFITFGTMPSMIASYLWLAIEHKKSVLVSGGTATGKTSALNALCLFLAPESKIVSIEDTPELRLPHEHWIAKVARTGYGPTISEGKRRGEVSMFDLLKAALRERPDELVVGEVRGAEAYVLFQGMSTGHQGLSTIHAESVDAVINRLKTKPINLSSGLLQHLDIIIIMGFSRVKGIDIRRVKEVVEIVGVDEKTEKPITNQLFRWIPFGDYFEFTSDKSYVFDEVIREKGVSENSIWEELQRRTAVLEWMKKENIRYYKDVGRIISEYYRNPDSVLQKMGGKR